MSRSAAAGVALAAGLFGLPTAAVFLAAYLLTPTAQTPPPRPSLPAGVLAALQQADRIELLSLDPNLDGRDGDRFYSWRILDRADVDPKQVGPEVADAIARGAAEPWPTYLCFDPRHGVRLSGPGGVVDLLLCFECGSARVYGLDGVKWFGTGPSPAATLDRLLAERGVPLAAKP